MSICIGFSVVMWILLDIAGSLGGFDHLKKSIIIAILFENYEVQVNRWLTINIGATSGQ